MAASISPTDTESVRTIQEAFVMAGNNSYSFPDAKGFDVQGGALLVLGSDKVLATFRANLWDAAFAEGTAVIIERDLELAAGA
jgi:hypothetical protein